MKNIMLPTVLACLGAGVLFSYILNTREEKYKKLESYPANAVSNIAPPSTVGPPSTDWPLLPPKGSKRMIIDDQEFNKAIIEAEKGDMEYMFGLIDWYSRHGDNKAADNWLKKLDEERKRLGLVPYIESMPPIMNGDKPIPKRNSTQLK
jgi:hypothetical protein